ncbi:MAG: chemotaxis protein CheA [Deltaproteobacteria bacterium]|nr:chemotaxis protein CheA [Candidatus Anaeroferrophillacea bacterium]
MIDQHREAFREEAFELLAELETALMELEESPEDIDLVGRVFRAMHTIKGSGAMFGFEDVAAFTHNVETTYDHIRNGELRVSKEVVDGSLAACDQIRRMVTGDPRDEDEEERILAVFQRLLATAGGKIATAATPPPAAAAATAAATHPGNDDGSLTTYRIRFVPEPQLFATGTNPLLLLDELRGFGPAAVTAQQGRVPRLEDLQPEQCCLFWDIIVTTARDAVSIRDVFLFVEDDCELKIEVIDNDARADDDLDYRRLGEILLARGDVTAADLARAIDSQKRVGEILVETGTADRRLVESALAEQEHIRQQRMTRQAKAETASIRVAAEKLDVLVDLVGELVTIQASLSRTALTRGDADLLTISEEVERLTAELRDNTMGIRMLPIGTTFSKFKRLVRDLANELGKDVVLTTDGGETELDKTVIERLNDPLVHIIRNSIDHGIEHPAVRKAAGKPGPGTVHLTAEHSGTSVVVRITDDGAGLDPAVIRAKAVEKGIIAADADLDPAEILSLICAPGFSTAKAVTDVSGRGVGMDVVKRGVESLRGTLDISSTPGQGTTVTLKLPLTLAIIDGLLVRVGTAFYVLPLAVVEECIELSQAEMDRDNRRRMVNLRGEIVPYIMLRELFRIAEEAPPIQQAAIVDVDDSRVGFVVDEVIGSHQTVIKTLSRIYRTAREFSGATILADGSVALILDVHGLHASALQADRRRETHSTVDRP